MNTFNFNQGNNFAIGQVQTIGIELSPNSILQVGNIMPDRFNTIGEAHNFPVSSIGKSHKFDIGGMNGIYTPEVDYEERVG